MASSETSGSPDHLPIPPPIARATPPTAPPVATAVPASAARWPVILGVVLIIYAGLHLLGGICSIGSPIWNAAMRSSGGPSPPAFIAVGERWTRWSVALGVLGVGLGSLLLAVGIGLLNRRAWSIRLARPWCAGQIGLAIVQGIIGYLVQSDMLQAIAADSAKSPGPMPGAFAAGARIGATFGVIAGFVWAVGMAVFLLIWLSRPRVRAEYESWTQAGSSGVAYAMPRM